MEQMILLSGKMGSGKTTIQKSLIEQYNRRPNQKAVAINFADPLYEMMRAVQVVGDKYGLRAQDPKDRKLLQVLGTEWGRDVYGPDVWVNALEFKVAALRVRVGLLAYEHSLVVVGDCRFKNEFDHFPNALRVRLDCDYNVRISRNPAGAERNGHISETDLDHHDRARLFDLHVNTNTAGVKECVDLILEQLPLKRKK